MVAVGGADPVDGGEGGVILPHSHHHAGALYERGGVVVSVLHVNLARWNIANKSNIQQNIIKKNCIYKNIYTRYFIRKLKTIFTIIKSL